MFCKRLNGKCQFKKLCIYLCVVLALSLFASPVSAQIDWGAVENQIEGIRSNYNLPSIGYALVVEDTPVFTGAVGQANISENIDATADTPYQLASISKTFIAAVDRGRCTVAGRPRQRSPALDPGLLFGCQAGLFSLAKRVEGS